MAGAIDNPSRREVLGAALGVPLARHPGLDPGSTFSWAARECWIPDQVRNDEAWQRALAAYRSAEGAVEEAGRRCASCSRAEIHAAEDLYGDRLEALYDALRSLLTVPAPDIGAFCAKVDLMIEHELATLSDSAASLAAVREDARRFALFIA